MRRVAPARHYLFLIALLASMLGACQVFLDVGDDHASASANDAASADPGKGDAATNASSDASSVDAVSVDAARVDAALTAPCNKAVACERTVFVTSALYTGNLGGLAGADAKCTQLASGSLDPRVGGRTYVAWLSGISEFVSTRAVHGTGRYVRPDGNPIAADWTAFASSLHTQAIDLDEVGKPVAGSVWTGSEPDGTPASATCGGWTSDAQVLGAVGSDTAVTGSWSHESDALCSGMAHLYCIEE